MKSRPKRKKRAAKVTAMKGKRRNPRGQKGAAATPIAEAKRKRPRLRHAGTRNGLAISPRVAVVTQAASTTVIGPTSDGVADTAPNSASAMPVRRWRTLAENAQLSIDRARAPQGSGGASPDRGLQPQEKLVSGITLADLKPRLAKVAEYMSIALRRSTGLDKFSQQLITYWTLATHALPCLQQFPILCLIGKMGTGKSETLHIISKFAYRPLRFSPRGTTLPVIRDKFAECNFGTAIVEEADHAWKDGDMALEQMISDRYQTASAEASHKVKVGEFEWETERKQCFGATALHRRIPFKDPALDGRSVFVRFKPDHNRQYCECSDRDRWIVDGTGLICDLTFELPKVEQPPGVAARIFNTYKPVLGVAKLCGDETFLASIQNRLRQDTAELKEAQSIEPDGLVLRAIVEAIFSATGKPNFRNVKFSEISDSIWTNHRFSLAPRQIGPIAREIGFSTKTSHGVTVVVPTPAALLRACDECDYQDEAIAELRRHVVDGL